MKAIVLILCFWVQGDCSAEDVMYLNLSRIGKAIQVTNVLLISHFTNAIAPTKITLELNGTVVIGAVLEYPKAVTKDMLRKSFNSEYARHEIRIGSDAAYVWRDEQKKIAVLIGTGSEGVNMVCRSTDKTLLGDKTPQFK